MKLLARRQLSQQHRLTMVYSKILPTLPIELIVKIQKYNSNPLPKLRRLNCKPNSSVEDRFMDCQEYWKSFICPYLDYHAAGFALCDQGFQFHEIELEYVRMLIEEDPYTIFNHEEINRRMMESEVVASYISVRGNYTWVRKFDLCAIDSIMNYFIENHAAYWLYFKYII